MVPLFFAWQRPEIINGGHPFSVGYKSFVQRIDELRADMLAPERRKAAGVLKVAERQTEQEDADEAMYARVAAKYEQQPLLPEQKPKELL